MEKTLYYIKSHLEGAEPNGTAFPTRQVGLCSDPEYREIRGSENPELHPGVNLASTYESKTNLPENLPEDIFLITDGTFPRILLYERVFEQNTRHVLKTLSDDEGVYFIANCGVAHLFGVAKALREKGVDTAFYITKQAFPIKPELGIRSDSDAAIYYASEFKKIQASVHVVPHRIATLIDYHRNDSSVPGSIDQEAFATVEVLRSKKIKKILLLGEDYLTEEGVIRASENDLAEVLKGYQEKGFSIEVIRIDSRKNKLR